MTRGRPPKPLEQKRRTGNPGKRALPERGNLAAVPAISTETHELPVAGALDRVLSAGVAWLAETDAPTVSLLRDALEDYARLRDGGAAPKDIRDARDQVMRLLSLLGFDPTARARLGLAEVKARSTLEALRDRKEQRR